jgi:hypothetical protein
MKRWGMGVFHGFRAKYLNAYLNEYVSRWNRRHNYKSAFDRLVGIGIARILDAGSRMTGKIKPLLDFSKNQQTAIR